MSRPCRAIAVTFCVGLAAGLLVAAGCAEPKPFAGPGGHAAAEHGRGLQSKPGPFAWLIAPAAARDDRDALEPDIIAVRKFFPQVPWLQFDPAGDPAQGFRVTVYLVDARTRRGVWGDGDIIVQLYLRETDEQGRHQPKLLREWRLSPADAYKFRVRPEAMKDTAMGRAGHRAYQLRLDWRPLRLMGKPIMIQINFLRRDGLLIRSSPASFLVH